MRILVLGGTHFLGRHIVEVALARGHEVVLFNRGRLNAHLFAGIEKLRGDRDGDVSALCGRRFDAVMDTSAYRSEHIRAVTDVLGSGFTHYTFVSTISVYKALPPRRPFDESTPLAEGDQGYGALKARCEELLQHIVPGRVALVRPGLIAGPHDPTNRFTYWPRRVARGGHILAPGRPERPVQLVDARDLAEWCVQLAEHNRVGAYNAVGPQIPLTMARLLEDCAAVTGSSSRFSWVADEDLISAGIKPWTELPLWIPESDPRIGGMLLADNRRAVAAGLTFRPLVDTIRATLAWDRSEGAANGDGPNRATPLVPEREAELLARFA